MSAQPVRDFNNDPLFPMIGFVVAWRDGSRVRMAKVAKPSRDTRAWDLGEEGADLASHAILCREFQYGTCWAYVDIKVTGRKITEMPLSSGDGVRCRLTFQPAGEERDTVDAWIFPVADGKDEWTDYADAVPYTARWKAAFGAAPKSKWS